jgi:hypothetical protein
MHPGIVLTRPPRPLKIGGIVVGWMGQRRLFYGWVVLAVSAAITCLGMGTLFSLGVFLKPIEDSTGWSAAPFRVPCSTGCDGRRVVRVGHPL